jgi:hypothetical protein
MLNKVNKMIELGATHLISYPPSRTYAIAAPQDSTVSSDAPPRTVASRTAAEAAALAQRSFAFFMAVVLVSGPVFLEAPLVRFLPWLSLALSPLLFWSGKRLLATPKHSLSGDLLIGFAWTWVSGSIYWGWFRWEPVLHLPIEAIGLPFALFCIARNWGKVGNFFYLGSLLGTALTDIYFYLTDLMPYWRGLMRVEESDLAAQLFHNALNQINTPWGVTWAALLAAFLLGISFMTLLATKETHWWAFGGAVFSTILVDSLFAVAALVA